MLEFLDGVLRPVEAQFVRNPAEVRFADDGGASRKQLLQKDRSSLAGNGFDLELIHQPARPDYAETHSRLRVVAAFENGVQIVDSRALVADFDDEELGGCAALYEVLDFSASGIFEGVAGDFGERGRDAGLILSVKSEKASDLARALPRVDRVVLVADVNRQNREAHRSSTTRKTGRSSSTTRKTPAKDRRYRQ